MTYDTHRDVYKRFSTISNKVHEMSSDGVHTYMKCSRPTSISGDNVASFLADNMYHEVDLPSIVDVSMESSIYHLRAI